jgi:hypothetical protein
LSLERVIEKITLAPTERANNKSIPDRGDVDWKY